VFSMCSTAWLREYESTDKKLCLSLIEVLVIQVAALHLRFGRAGRGEIPWQRRIFLPATFDDIRDRSVA
jgi:hypothetical protein